MLKHKKLPSYMILIMISLVLFGAYPVRAQENTPTDGETITSEIIVELDIYDEFGVNKVTLTNRYYPYFGGEVKTDGKATANFFQPPSSRIKCQAHPYNAAGQSGTYKTNYSSYGGLTCPYTAKAVLSGGVVPTTYYSWTKGWWKWPNGTDGYGKKEQSHYEE